MNGTHIKHMSTFIDCVPTVESARAAVQRVCMCVRQKYYSCVRAGSTIRTKYNQPNLLPLYARHTSVRSFLISLCRHQCARERIALRTCNQCVLQVVFIGTMTTPGVAGIFWLLTRLSVMW
jgi:hypothetical protein